MAGISPARKAAFDALMAIEQRQVHADDLLRGRAVSGLSAADRHLVTTLVMGVLRWQIQLDRQVRALLAKPGARLDPEVLIALRLGAFQLLHLDRIPARAAIDESVELTKRAGHRYASGMVNAVLRKLAHAQPGSIPPPSKSAGAEAASESSSGPRGTAKQSSSAPDQPAAKNSNGSELAANPEWMVKRWTEFFGYDVACTICRHNQSPPTLAIRLTTPEVEAELVAEGIVVGPGALLTAARIVAAGDVTDTLAFREGRVRIQDEGSQLIAELAAHAGEHGKPLERILDCCAAPGGKTFILAERNPGACVVACEASAPRLEQLRSRVEGLGPRVDCRLADATALEFNAEFDAALADVPCSGTGTLSRNPEIRHRLLAADLPRQAERQQAILSSALRAVRPRGRVVYSTCSLEREENEAVISAVPDNPGNTRVLPLSILIERLRENGTLRHDGADALMQSVTPEGYLQLIPGQFGTDGFFACLLERMPAST